LVFENILGLDDTPYKQEKEKERERRRLNQPSSSDKLAKKLSDFSNRKNKKGSIHTSVDENLRKALGIDEASLPKRQKNYIKIPGYALLIAAKTVASAFAGLVSEEKEKEKMVNLVRKELAEKRARILKKELRRRAKRSVFRIYEKD